MSSDCASASSGALTLADDSGLGRPPQHARRIRRRADSASLASSSSSPFLLLSSSCVVESNDYDDNDSDDNEDTIIIITTTSTHSSLTSSQSLQTKTKTKMLFLRSEQQHDTTIDTDAFPYDSTCSSTFSSSTCHPSSSPFNGQLLVKFCNQTHVLNLSPLDDEEKDAMSSASSSATAKNFLRLTLRLQTRILALVSDRTGWPAHLLCLPQKSWMPPFCDVLVLGGIRGGKGGFGTLLKGQSRQASNKTTLDFAACRDLQGRRLRTVNDEISQRLHREWRSKIQSGQATQEDMIKALADTSSGIAGWFLQLPAWAEKGASKAAKRKHQAQFRLYKRQLKEKTELELAKKQQQEQHVANYVQATQTSLVEVTSQIQQAVQQGLMLAKAKVKPQQQERQQQQQQQQQDEEQQHSESRKRKHLEEDSSGQQYQEEKDDDEEEAHDTRQQEEEDEKQENGTSTSSGRPPSALVTLSGEVVEVNDDNNNDNSCRRVQGASNFATVGVLVRGDGARGGESRFAATCSVSNTGLYYEVVVVNGGLVQVGWVLQQPQLQQLQQTETTTTLNEGAALSSSAALSLPLPFSFPFLNSEAGDGVGDVPGSWSYDGSRQIKLQYSSSSFSSSSAAADTASTTTTTTAAATATATKNSNKKEEEGSSNTAESSYGQLWKAGDVVGCLYHNGTIQFFLNGQDLGVAFEGVGVEGGSVMSSSLLEAEEAAPTAKTEENEEKNSPQETPSQHMPLLIPAVSLNPGEVVEFRLHRQELQFFHDTITNTKGVGNGVGAGAVVPVGEVLLEQVLLETEEAKTATTTAAVATETTAEHGITEASQPRKVNNNVDAAATGNSPPSKEKPAATFVGNNGNGEGISAADASTASVVLQEEPSVVAVVSVETNQSINLEDFDSVEQLESIGLVRLKETLTERGLKCGGTLRERATRLFSVKGLSPQEYPKKLLARKQFV